MCAIRPADMVWALVQGNDPRPPHRATPDNPFVDKKTVSVDLNWGLRFASQDQVDAFFRRLCQEALVRSTCCPLVHDLRGVMLSFHHVSESPVRMRSEVCPYYPANKAKETRCTPGTHQIPWPRFVPAQSLFRYNLA